MFLEGFEIDDGCKVLMNSGSRGCQLKYLYHNRWFKVNTSGYENMAEYLCYLILAAQP